MTNPGFEKDKPGIPSRSYNVIKTPNYPLLEGWVVPTTGTADYYNSDRSTVFGSPIKKARSGQGRIGLIAKQKRKSQYSEYVTTQLSQPLEADKFYVVSMYYCLDRRCTWAARTFGICFTNNYITYDGSTVFPLASQITSDSPEQNMVADGWVHLRKVYQAKGGEQYLTIGCFDTQTSVPVTGRKTYVPVSKLDGKNNFHEYAYYYVDDVCVTEITDDPLCNTCCAALANVDAHNNFLFMLDVSSSMSDKGYLDEAKRSLVHFMDTLKPNDRVSLVAFDGHSRVLARSVPLSEKDSLVNLVNSLQSGTFTNIDKAIAVSYKIMDSCFVRGKNNRVFLISDAAFDLSKQSSKTITESFQKRDIAFTMIQFGNQYNKKLEKTCKKTSGNYARTKKENIDVALANQLDKKIKNEYTEERPRASHFKIYKTGSLKFPTEPVKH